MPINNATPPKGFSRQLGHRLTEVLQTRTGARFLNWKYESVPMGTKPHPVYTIGRDDILDREPWLKDAELVAWRSLLQVGRDSVHAVELRPDDLGLVGISKGRFGAATLKTVGAALESADDDEQEMRLLRVPSLYFIAVWLHGKEKDSILPLEDHPSGLKRRFPYTPEAVQEALRPWAERVRDMDYGLDEAN